jgi:NADH-quinone oxidoreductase subunit N
MLPALMQIAWLPEAVLGSGILVTVLVGALCQKRWAVYQCAVGFVVISLAAVLSIQTTAQLGLNGHGLFDDMAQLLKAASAISVLCVLLYSQRTVESDPQLHHEYMILILSALLGAYVVISAMHMLTLFVGFELMSLPLYALVAIRSKATDAASTAAVEAALKYFITGALASACLLYGLSLIFGATGHMHLMQVMTALAHLPLSQHHGAVLGLIFVIVALAFKLGLVPFHMWVPDVYEGAPMSVTLLIATLPKIALIALCVRLFGVIAASMADVWQPILIGLGVLSMVLGNGAALCQTHVRRLLGYSAIGHMGVLILAFVLAQQHGLSIAVFYVLTYALTTALIFGGLLQLRVQGGHCEQMQELSGLNHVYPGQAGLLLLGIFSLAGVPPIVGFMAKFSLIQGLIRAQYTTLAIIVVLMACVACFYYIRLIKVLYFDQSEGGALMHWAPVAGQWCLRLHGVAVLALGLMPAALMKLCESSVLHLV